eukprot:TRINITY_DN30776_c0_g1_i1.p1 TRINITY_DN30776_c0_g1~~TRINITY_DN30776_c0_g1_i1.p1  ORF type:complete len:325 (+),score=78.93 TRINITY_DN30776_c0_g1_i1:70-975(+)
MRRSARLLKGMQKDGNWGKEITPGLPNPPSVNTVFHTGVVMKGSGYDIRAKGRPPDDPEAELAQPMMAAYCIHVLESKLNGWKAQKAGALIPDVRSGAFVSFLSLSRRMQAHDRRPPRGHDFLPMRDSDDLASRRAEWDSELLGCIGCHAPGPLRTELPRLALAAAFRDPRRPEGIVSRDLGRLKCVVTLISQPVRARHWEDWELGHHGIKLLARTPEGVPYDGTFLPNVAVEQGWGRRTTVEMLLRKAGWPLSVEEGLQRCFVQRFEASSAEMSYWHYMQGQARTIWAPEPEVEADGAPL